MKLSTILRRLLCGLSAVLLVACASAPRVEARQAKAFDSAELVVLTNRNGETLPRTRQRAMQLALPLKPDTAEQPKPTPADADELKRYVGKYAHAPQTWEVFVKDGKLFLKGDGRDFELTKLGRDRFGYERGEVLFVPDETGAVGHIFMGLYAARRAQ